MRLFWASSRSMSRWLRSSATASRSMGFPNKPVSTTMTAAASARRSTACGVGSAAACTARRPRFTAPTVYMAGL